MHKALPFLGQAGNPPGAYLAVEAKSLLVKGFGPAERHGIGQTSTWLLGCGIQASFEVQQSSTVLACIMHATSDSFSLLPRPLISIIA